MVGSLFLTATVAGVLGAILLGPLGALLLNSLLYRSELLPRWIAGWALVAVVPYVADACLVMFGVLDPSSAVHSVLLAPLALNEVMLAVWLLAKGFRPPNPA